MAKIQKYFHSKFLKFAYFVKNQFLELGACLVVSGINPTNPVMHSIAKLLMTLVTGLQRMFSTKQHFGDRIKKLKGVEN